MSDLDFVVRSTPAMDDVIARFGERIGIEHINLIGSRAINRTEDRIVSHFAATLADEINLTPRDIRDQFQKNRATVSDLEGTVVLERKPIPLIEFIGTSQTAEGVSALVRDDRGPEQIAHAFLQTMPSGHVGAFIRRKRSELNSEPSARPRHGDDLAARFPSVADELGAHPLDAMRDDELVGRKPFRELFGPSLTAVVSHAPEMLAEEMNNSGEMLQHEVDRQVNYMLRRAGIIDDDGELQV